MNDIFNNPLTEGTLILFPTGTNYCLAKIISVTDHSELSATLTVVNEHNSYGYSNVSNFHAINVNDTVTRINDFDKRIANVENNEKAILEKFAKAEAEKAEELSEQRKLRDTLKPGDAFSGKQWNTQFMYLGQDEDRMHMYLKMHKSYSYRRSSDEPNYTLYINTRSFIQKLKAKKLPYKFIPKEEYNLEEMLQHAQRDLVEAIRRNRNNEYLISIEDIDNVRELAKTFGV